MTLDIAYRLGEALYPPAPGHTHPPLRAPRKPAIGAPSTERHASGVCAVCGGDVFPLRRVYCSQACSDVVYGSAAKLDPIDLARRRLLALRDQAAAIELRGREHVPTLLDPDGRPRVPTQLVAEIAALARWVSERGSKRSVIAALSETSS